MLFDATSPTVDLMGQYVVPAIIGALGGVIGGLITASAMLLDGARQREQEKAAERERLAESRKSALLEIKARLHEFADQIGYVRKIGWADDALLQATFDRLNELMRSEAGGGASLPSAEAAQLVYSMLSQARISLRYLGLFRAQLDDAGKSNPNDYQNALERLGMHSSAAVQSTRTALLAVYDALGDKAGTAALAETEGPFEERQKSWAARLDAERQAAARAVAKARSVSEPAGID